MCNFKIGDKVRLKKKETTEEYYGIMEKMLDQPTILTIRNIGYGSCDGDRIIVNENGYNYHPSWLEKVKNDEKGYLVINGYHFGSSKIYSWLCDKDLFDVIQLEDLVEVDTAQGNEIIKVVSKCEQLKKGTTHKRVIRRLTIQ